MTTQELKQQIDKVLGNSIRCLLPSYWWKRLFSLTLEKVDEKLDATNIKTINGESIVGEGNLKVGVTTVGSIDELNTLEASVGDIATIGEESTILVSVGDLQQVDDPSEILEKWDNLTRIVKVEFGEPVTEIGYHTTVYLNGKKPYGSDTILITSSEGGFFCGYGSAAGIREITIEEVNERLKNHDYRFIMGINVDVIDSTFKLHAYSASADAYIKGETWTRFLKEGDVTGGGADITIDSELSDTSENPVQNKVVTEALGILEEHLAVHSKQISSLGLSMATKEELNNKADKSDIKTINGVSLLGGGDITISGGGVSEDYVNTAIANAITNTLNTEV